MSYWSGASNTCSIPGCSTDAVTVPAPVTVTVTNANGALQAGLLVYCLQWDHIRRFFTDHGRERAGSVPTVARELSLQGDGE